MPLQVEGPEEAGVMLVSLGIVPRIGVNQERYDNTPTFYDDNWWGDEIETWDCGGGHHQNSRAVNSDLHSQVYTL